MRDVVLDDIAHEEHREPDAHDGQHQVEEIMGGGVEARRQQVLDEADELVQHGSCHGGKDAYEEREDNHQLLLRQPRSPFHYICYHKSNMFKALRACKEPLARVRPFGRVRSLRLVNATVVECEAAELLVNL